MKDLESAAREIIRLGEKATGTWGVLPGVGEDEDEGCMLVGAVGPSYRFLIGDYWEYAPNPKPMHILSEEEAQARAKADQMFAAHTANHAVELAKSWLEMREALRAIDKHNNDIMLAAEDIMDTLAGDKDE